MTCHKLALLLLFLAKCSSGHDSEEIIFKPIDEGVGPIVDRYLNPEPRDLYSEILDEFQSILSDGALKLKERQVLKYFKEILKKYDNYNVSKGIELQRINRVPKDNVTSEDEDASIVEDLLGYADNHVIKVRLYELVEDVQDRVKRTTGLDSSSRWGNRAYLTGLGLAFIAFGLKNLMVPVMIGVQIVKSVIFAMFLPSLIGGLGKVVGEGVKYLSSHRFPPVTGMGHAAGQMEDFEFKDANNYDNQQYSDAQPEGSASLYSYAYPNQFDYNKLNVMGMYSPQAHSSIANRYTSGAHKLNYIPNNNHHGSFYTKHSDKHGKRQDYKVFHNIPPSSLLLTNYDPFYSPLLSRMDTVFKQLGYETEFCRERLVCQMYKTPAKFAPYSNLISAQLSRELNELRKPSSDNPDILRFFKYMKAAKDGQDGVECSKVYPDCYDSRESISSPMVKTYNEINKLVHARKL